MSNSKFIYNLKGITRFCTPKIFAQKSLESKIKQIFTKLDSNTLESMANRIRFYHKINTPFRIVPLPLPKHNEITRDEIFNPHFDKLQNNKPTNKHATTYFYDSYEWSRFFSDELVWHYEFGDVNYYLSAPAITKSRPISDKNANSILFKLEKNRHFNFIKDPYKFEEKKDILFFRGAAYQKHRIDFLKKYFNAPFCDLGHTGNKEILKSYYKPKISLAKHLPYKFLLSLEGNDVASNLKWILSSNSLCVMPKPKYETWFMESLLRGGVHYCEIADDYEDLQEKLEYYITHPNEAKEIIQNAHQYCAQFMDKRIEDAACLLVLRKYFYLSGQIEISRDERELFGV